ncbi:hypothetical protein KY313_02905 [Candidatus Woesearchaeota archaeon]|jgi:hypothetical protein|nr:hypothetical protein [Candidatus Woesearchaeota archaeon]
MPGKKKKDKSLKYLIYGVTIIIAIFLILFIMGKILPQKDGGYYYNGFSFVKGKDMWFTQIQPPGENKLYTIELRYGPRDLEEIPIIGNPEIFLTINKTYITFNPEDNNLKYIGLAIGDIDLNLIKVLGIELVAACTKNHSACSDRPIKNCENTKAPVILVQQDPVAFVEQKGNCLIVQGNDFELVKAADRLLLYLYGIMD